jgi:hypothetical protein
VRQIQKIFRGFYVRRREFRVWRSLGALARRPKPTKRKTSFLGAAKCHLFSEGPNNWELKERVGEIPDDILHSVGFAKKSSHRKVPIRTPFFDRRRQAHSRKLRAEEVAAEERRRQEGVFECRKCKQRGKFAGHICCCHLRPSCVSCQKNQRSWRVNGRPGNWLSHSREGVRYEYYTVEQKYENNIDKIVIAVICHVSSVISYFIYTTYLFILHSAHQKSIHGTV